MTKWVNFFILNVAMFATSVQAHEVSMPSNVHVLLHLGIAAAWLTALVGIGALVMLGLRQWRS